MQLTKIMKRFTLLSLLLSLISTTAYSQPETAAFTVIQKRLLKAIEFICSSGALVPFVAQDLARQLDYLNSEKSISKSPSGHLIERTVLTDPKKGKLLLVKKNINSQFKTIEIEASALNDMGTKPVMLVRLDSACRIIWARYIYYNKAGELVSLIHLNANLNVTKTREPFNPKVPKGKNYDGISVAHIDSGVNYLLPEFTNRLARDEHGRIRGWDFWDNDDRPFDINIITSPFFPLHHGTAVASILLREAPKSNLIPYRYPRPNMAIMANVINAAASAQVRIALLPMGSSRKSEWAIFANAAKRNQQILFVVSAGNNGRNIDEIPLFPASLTLENIIVVTAADDFGRLAPDSNWGAKSVDLMVPGENIEVIDHRGAIGRASGASFAAPRIAALAARYLAKNPLQTTAELKAEILRLAARPRMRGEMRVKAGWIPNPTDHN